MSPMPIDIISRLLGWIYVLCWSLSFYPQPILNYRRQSTAGLAIDFPTANVVRFLSYTISTAAFLYSPLIRTQYAYRNPISPTPTVRFNDFAFGIHATVLCLLTYSQFWNSLWGFHTSQRQRVSKPVFGVIVGCMAGVLSVILIVAFKSNDGGTDPDGWAWIDVIYAFSYVKLIVTVMKYIPQAWMNYKRKSTIGWSIYQIQLDLWGGVLSLIQLFLDASVQNDWSGVTGNPVKFGLGNVSILFDIIFMLQHYWFYRDAKDVENAEGRPLLSGYD